MGILDDYKKSQDVNVISDYEGFQLQEPLLSKPIKHAGYKLFIEDVNTDAVLETSKPVDIFRRDIYNYWSANPNIFDDSEVFKLRALPEEEYNSSNQKVLKVYSSELNSYIYLQKISTQFEGATKGMLGKRKIENYAVYLKPEDIAMISESQPNPNWWKTYISNYFNQGQAGGYGLSDHNFFMDAPLYSEAETTDSKAQKYVHVKSNYNFQFSEYEASIEDDSIDEKLLPNLYTYMLLLEENNKILFSNLDRDNEKSEILNSIEQHATLNGDLDFNFNLVKLSEERNKGVGLQNPLKTNTISRYFSAWSEAAPFFATDEEDSLNTIDNFATVVFSEASYESVFKHNSSVRNFPMNVNISFTTDTNKEFFNILKECNLTQTFMHDHTYDPDLKTEAAFVQLEGEQYFVGPPRQMSDFEKLLNKAISGNLDTSDLPEDYVFLGDLNHPQTSLLNGDAKSIISKLFGLSVKSKVVDLIEKYDRDFERILSGEAAYSETLFYEIEKYSSNSEGHLLELKQTFLLPNDNEKVIEFFDTQVKYNKYYVYKMYAHKVVTGTRYDISVNDQFTNDENFAKSAIISVRSIPSIKTLRVPYYNVNESGVFFFNPNPGQENFIAPTHKTTIVLDDPPLPPEVEILPVIGKPRDLIINIKDTIGSVEQKSLTLGEEDTVQHAQIFKNQYSNKHNVSKETIDNSYTSLSKILFKSDEPSSYFEIYKIKNKPTSYSDFKNNLFLLLDGPNNSTITNLAFNEKNYFTFRSVDPRGNFSNLSEIYEVELKENSGLSFPVIRVFDLEEEAIKDSIRREKETSPFSLSGKRFIMIKPTMNQSVIPESYEDEDISAPDVQGFTLGDQEKSVFQKNRKFKIRIRSKKTGRVVDLNLQCKHLHDKINLIK